MPTPAPVAADSTGLPDSVWITKVRDALRDYPKGTTETWTADGTNGFVGYTGAPLTVAKPPINITGDILAGTSTLLIRDFTASQNYTVITSGTPSGTQVLVNHDTGEVQWASAPTAGHIIQYGYQFCRWTDQSITNALYDGLHAMFPRVGKTYTDIEIPIQVNVWDYALPVWFQDPRSRLLSIEIADPYIPTEPFRPAPPGIRRIGLTTLHLPWSQRFSPVARLRIQGWGPYLTLGDLEPQLHDLPIWSALGTLLPKQETKRIREDTMVPLAQSGGQTPGQQLQTGDYFTRRFEAAMTILARTPGPGPSLPISTSYQAGYARHGRR
jgi:hypothetical protein